MRTLESLLPITLPDHCGKGLHWSALHGSSPALAALLAARKHQSGPVLLITPDSYTATQLYYEIQFYAGTENALPLAQFPDWETLPYDSFSPHEDIISARLRLLRSLPQAENGIILVSIGTLLTCLPPTDFISRYCFSIAKGDTLDMDTFRLQLTRVGYQSVSQVMHPGQFSIRGSIIDIFPMGSANGLRLDLFDNEIESLRSFEPESQRSLEQVDHYELMPAHEFPLDEEAITRFRTAWRNAFSGAPTNCATYNEISQGHGSAGVEYYLPLFFESPLSSLVDYLPKTSLCIKMPGTDEAGEQFISQVHERYEQLAHDIQKPLLEPAGLFLTINSLNAELNNLLQIRLSADTKGVAFPTLAPPHYPVNHHDEYPLTAIVKRLEHTPKRTLFCAESTGRREALLELLANVGIRPLVVSGCLEFLHSSAQVAITIGALEHGLLFDTVDIEIIAESQLFENHVMQRRRRRAAKQVDADAVIKSLVELKIGDPIVHLDHGVGRYLGLSRISLNDLESEYLQLEYQCGDKLYVPVASLHLISRYTGADKDHAPLYTLGTEKWQREKRKAREKIRDVAAQLLELYAKREARTGYTFKAPDENYHQFAASFPFEETPDQAKAITDSIEEMCSIKCMDRLICGDVGFGKTEVAMRAAFLAVQSGKQVAMLVPTTLLAQQHFENFTDRFADWPVTIGLISRFKTKKEQEEVIAKLGNGKLDIVIGTHKLILKEIAYHDLGLLVIDEEHRFGVRQKDEIKAMRSEVDILTLTATPIPRTLNMALSGMRDLSIIATPPAKRLSIKTFIQQRNFAQIREAILREIHRGGQIYFVHNKVESIEQVTRELEKLIPEAKFAIAHGQMRERELEQVMSAFYHRHYQVLVCTTIIETGIDIPTANTIIIDRADHFGLAQLHQLRGRVGRSHHQAYAYLIAPEPKAMTTDAKRRLEAITELEELGIGFTLATHDLEIRGAGEFLGDEQSGHVHAIGFSLYMELLERTINSLQRGEPIALDSNPTVTEVDLHFSALIPDDYLPDVHSRLILYKRIASAESLHAIKELQVEMIDRFGLLPPATENLFDITKLKLHAQTLGIKKLDLNTHGGTVEFDKQTQVDPRIIIRLIQTKPARFKLDGPDKLRFIAAETLDNAKRYQAAYELLSILGKK